MWHDFRECEMIQYDSKIFETVPHQAINRFNKMVNSLELKFKMVPVSCLSASNPFCLYNTKNHDDVQIIQYTNENYATLLYVAKLKEVRAYLSLPKSDEHQKLTEDVVEIRYPNVRHCQLNYIENSAIDSSLLAIAICCKIMLEEDVRNFKFKNETFTASNEKFSDELNEMFKTNVLRKFNYDDGNDSDDGDDNEESSKGASHQVNETYEKINIYIIIIIYVSLIFLCFRKAMKKYHQEKVYV